MKRYFDELSREVSERTTKKYSTSFSLGILALAPAIRPAIYAIYGYVRLADEIVDSFHDYDKKVLLNRLLSETKTALHEKISLNPILQSFQETVHHYSIDRGLIEDFLRSMAMDLDKMQYNESLYEQYIFGSAEVVGLMCLQVFANGNREEYNRLKPYAQKLGSAFQKVNFLRDLKDDYRTLGRTYFPNITFDHFNTISKQQIEAEIEAEFKEALVGIKQLPHASRFGVYLAYKYYLSLFRKIKSTRAERIMATRVRVPNAGKLLVMVKSYIRYKAACL